MRLTPNRCACSSRRSATARTSRYRLNMIPTERVRRSSNANSRDAWLSRAEVAHYLDMKQIDLDRQLGYEPGKNGRRQRRCGSRPPAGW